MGILESDLLYKYTSTGTTVNPELSLGGTCNPNTIPSGVSKNIFDDVTGQEAADGKIEYRCIGIHNTLSTHVWMNTSIRVDGFVRHASSPDSISFWVERPAGTGGNPDGTVQIVTADTIAPTGATWTAEAAPSAWKQISGKDYIGSIGADDWGAIWLKREVPAGAEAFTDRSCTLRVQGETSASPTIVPVSIVIAVHWVGKEFKLERILGEGLVAKLK